MVLREAIELDGQEERAHACTRNAVLSPSHRGDARMHELDQY